MNLCNLVRFYDNLFLEGLEFLILLILRSEQTGFAFA
jgi:hypothetical protein